MCLLSSAIREGERQNRELTKLKEQLVGQAAEAECIDRSSALDLAKLCADVETNAQRGDPSRGRQIQAAPALDLEIEEHQAFARDRANHFRGR